MNQNSPYYKAHLFVAAMRIIGHHNSAPPNVDEVSTMLSLSVEQGLLISRKLIAKGIIAEVEGAYGTRLIIKDHLKLEEIPQDEPESKLEEELKKFQVEKNGLQKKVASIKAEQDKKKKDLFAQIEKKLKTGLKKNSV
jgi:hypothetical protein